MPAMLLIGMEQRVLHRAVAMEVVVEDHVPFLNRAEIAHHKRPVVIWTVKWTPEAILLISLRTWGFGRHRNTIGAYFSTSNS